MTLICGIDEARRGPIIGPMVMCGAFIEEDDMKKLLSAKPKDSKLLTADQRGEIYSKLIPILPHYKVIVVNPDEIDKAVKGGNNLNLNWLEAHKQALILNEFNPDKAIIDCPSNNIEGFRTYLKSLLKGKKIELTLEHNAERYPIVAAASIIAKVTGDRIIEDMKKEMKVDFGSGYLSDPKTVDFLNKNYESHKDIFRKSWFPYQELMNKKFQRSLSDFSQFLKEEKKTKSHTIDDLKKLEDHGFHFEEPKTEHELARMKGPCTIVLYKNGTLLVQGKDENKAACNKILGLE